jgi:hypothetical protein
MKQCFIEIILWDKNWIRNKFKTVKHYSLCVRYNTESFVCILDGVPTLVKETEIKRIISKNKREVGCKEYLEGRAWLAQVLNSRKFFIEPKGFLKQYIKVFTECQINKT